MMVRPNINQLLDKIDSRYRLVIATSRRARQIANGSKPLTNVKEESTVTIAAHEISEGAVKIIDIENNSLK